MASARRSEFFQHSLRLIHHQGYKGTTMRDIASELNCDVANLYNFVKSKLEILDQSLFGINEEFQTGIDAIINSKYDALDKLRQITRLYVRLTSEKPYEISLLVNAWRHLPPERKEAFLKEKKSYEKKVKMIIIEGMEKGTMKSLDPELATNMVLSSMRWLFDKYVEGTEKLSEVEIERQINQFVISGISN